MIIKQDSVWAKDLFPNEYLDFVYIDAGHTYQEVMDDLTNWWDKCKSGGVFGGHDYGYPSCPEVKKAVDDFIKSKIPTFITELNTLFIGTRVGESSEWAIIKP
jgi:hypothetical protein